MSRTSVVDLAGLPSDHLRYYSVGTLADLLDVSVATVWRWARNGDAPPLNQISSGTTRGRSSEWNEFLLDPAGWRAAHHKAVRA